MEGFGVFGIEFEDLPHFNASGFFQMPFAVRALVPFMGRADVKDLGIDKVTTRFGVNIMGIHFIGTTADIVHIHDRGVNEDGALIKVESNRAHKARNGSCRPDLLVGSHHDFIGPNRIGDLDSFTSWSPRTNKGSDRPYRLSEQRP